MYNYLHTFPIVIKSCTWHSPERNEGVGLYRDCG